MSASRKKTDETRKLLDQRTEELDQAESKSVVLESEVTYFSTLSRAVREKYEAGSKQGFLPSFFSKQPDPKSTEAKQVEMKEAVAPASVAAENRTTSFPNPFHKAILTTKDRIEHLQKNIKKYKDIYPQAYSAGLKFIAEAYHLSASHLSAEDIVSLDKSLDCAISLVKTPSKSTVDAACQEIKVAIGHQDKFQKLSGLFMLFAGSIITCVCLMLAPPISLLGLGLVAGGLYLINRSQPKSIAAALETFVDKAAQCSIR